MAELWDHAVALARDKHPLWGDKTVAAFVALTIASATGIDLSADAAFRLIVGCVDGPAPLDMALRVLAKKERQTAPGFVERRAVVVLERARDELVRRATERGTAKLPGAGFRRVELSLWAWGSCGVVAPRPRCGRSP